MYINSMGYLRHQRGELWTAYMLYILFFTAPIGLIFNMIKSHQYRGMIKQDNGRDSEALDMMASHHEWLIRTFVGTIVLAMMGLGTIYYIFGYVFVFAAVVWWIYHLGRGIVALTEGKALSKSF